jgi:hypothetical protein
MIEAVMVGVVFGIAYGIFAGLAAIFGGKGK